MTANKPHDHSHKQPCDIPQERITYPCPDLHMTAITTHEGGLKDHNGHLGSPVVIRLETTYTSTNQLHPLLAWPWLGLLRSINLAWQSNCSRTSGRMLWSTDHYLLTSQSKQRQITKKELQGPKTSPDSFLDGKGSQCRQPQDQTGCFSNEMTSIF